MWVMWNLQTTKNHSLFRMWMLYRKTRSSLSVDWNMHWQKKLQIFHNFFMATFLHDYLLHNFLINTFFGLKLKFIKQGRHKIIFKKANNLNSIAINYSFTVIFYVFLIRLSLIFTIFKWDNKWKYKTILS